VRLGCGGCLGTLLLVILLLGLAGGALWAVGGVLGRPDLPSLAGPAGDPLSAERKLSELIGRRRSRAPVVLTEGEVTALLARRLPEAADLPLRGLVVRLPGAGTVEVAGAIPLQALARGTQLAGVVGALPQAWRDRPVWLRLRARPRVEEGAIRRYLRLDVDRFFLGRQRLPVFVLRLLLDPAALSMLRWPLPSGIAAVDAETGRVVIRPGS